MGRKIREFRPNEVLVNAIYSGLSALVRLSYKRKNDSTNKFYEKTRSNWEDACIEWESCRKQGSHDFSSIQNKEPILRRLYLQMLWYGTVRYGNKEFKRVYSWREGTVGPLNELLNYMGSQLRDILVPRYYFPDPNHYQIRKYRDGRREIIPKSVADKIPPEKGVKVYQKSGYRGNSKRPRVLLAHPSLPALDFVDMIRAHLIELCRQCFIHAVPRLEFQRYIRLLIHRLTPFLDWVYTRGKVGRKNFYPDADRELRKIVLEIRTHFSNRSGVVEGMSRQIEAPPFDFGADSLKEKVKVIMDSSEKKHIQEKGKVILDLIQEEIITDTEISRFREEITGKAQREGNDWHRVLLSGLCHPRSLKEAVFAGDQFLWNPSGIQYLAEVPVVGNHGAGKIDLVLFARMLRGAGQYIWFPVMILEVKTKEAFNFNIYGMRPRTRKMGVYVPTLHSWKVPLTEREWNAVLGSRPPKAHLDQLDVYEEMILSELNALVKDPLTPKHVWKGVVTLDVSQDYEVTKRSFDQLIGQLAAKLLEGEFTGHWKTLKFEDSTSNELAPRVAITMTPAQGPVYLLRSIIPAKATQNEDPFTDRVEDDVFFTQYISVPSPTSSGKSAAWLAKNWHLLNHLSELADATPSSPLFLWIDLLGDYSSERMVNMRFGLEALWKKRLITQAEFTRLSGFLKHVHFVNLQKEIDDLILMSGPLGLENLRGKIKSVLVKGYGERVAIVDGWSDLETMVPRHRRSNLQVLELSLLEILKKLDEVIWVDSGVNHAEMSRTYQRPCVNPLYHNSPRRQLVDEIIWNLPTAPREIGWMSPQYDETRVIIQNLPIGSPPWMTAIHVPHLRGWTRRFSAAAASNAPAKADKYVGTLNQQQNMHGRSFHGASIQVRNDMISRESLEGVKKRAFSLIPSLWKPRQGRAEILGSDDFSQDWSVAYHPVDNNQTHPSLTSRLHLDLTQLPPRPNRLGRRHEGIHVEANQITRGWIHKERGELDKQPVTISRRSPLTYLVEPSRIDTADTRRRETHRLLNAATFLKDRASILDSFFSLYQEIIVITDIDNRQSIDEQTLRSILTRVRDVLLQRTGPRLLWMLLSSVRLSLGDLLNLDNQKLLRLAQRQSPEILDLYGMNLFLAVLSVADRVFKDVESPSCIELWSAVARWQLYQMGFPPEDDDYEYRYDFQAIHSNLQWRAKQMKKMVSREKTRFPERFGQLLWKEGSEGGSIWLLFPSLKNIVYGGLLEGQMNAYLPFGWYRCIINPLQAKTEAESALSRDGWDVLPIVLIQVNKQQVLYIKSEEDEQEWAIAGAFEYGAPPKEKRLPVRWVRLSEPRPETLLALHGYRPSRPPSDAHVQCDRVLQEAADWSGVIREVSCVLTINLERRIYRINLLEGSKPIARKETPYTDEIIRFLRYPQRTGEYFSTPDGTCFKWDPIKDVEYDEVMVKNKEGKREYYHLSVLKPLIHRSTFFSDSLTLPSTCEDLLGTSESGDIILRITVDEEKKSRGFKKYLKVHLDGLKEEGHISGLESEEMGIFDVALLAECSQLVDIDSRSRYNISIDARALVNLGSVHLLSDYSKLENAIAGHIEELELAEHDEMNLNTEDRGAVIEEGPELRFVKANVEESVRRRILNVIVRLCNTADEDDFEELSVFSVSSEIVKTQSIAYDYIEKEVRFNLRGRRVSDDTRDEMMRGIEGALRRKKVMVDYY